MYLRKLLLQSSSEDYRVWIHALTERLHINWRGNRSLFIGALSIALCASGDRRVLMKVSLRMRTM